MPGENVQMQMPNGESLPPGAVDLAAVKDAADKASAEADAARLRDIQERAQSWDRAMTRTFRGIVPAPERRRQLQRAVEAANADE